MVDKVAVSGTSSVPDHLDELEKTHTLIDQVHTTQDNPYGEINFIGTYVAILLACCASFAGFIMPVTALTSIEMDLGSSPNAIWVSLGWVLLSAVSFVLLGRLSDIFGRRWFFTGCTVSALIGSIIGATAQKIEVLIAASVFLGLGSSGQLSFNYSLGELVPVRHRFAANGFIFLSTLPFSGIGPYVARLLIVNTPSTWRSIYHLAIGLNAASTMCWLIFYHPPDFKHLHRNCDVMDEIREMDFGGIFLYMAGFFLFLLGLAWGGSVHPWSSSYVLAPLIIGFFTFVGFIIYETYMDLRRPLIPMRLFRNTDFVILNILSAVGGVVYYTANTLFPYMVASLYATNIIEAGLVASCIGGGVCAGQFIGSWAAVPGGLLKYKLIFISCGLAAFVAGLGGATNSQAVGSALAVCSGLMIGLLEVIVSTAVTIVIDDQSEIGTAAGVFGGIRAAAGVLATAIYSSVFTNKIAQYTLSDVVPALVEAGLPLTSVEPFLGALGQADLPAVEQVPGVTPSIIQIGVHTLTEAYAEIWRIVWLGTLAFGLLAVFTSLFTTNINDRLTHDVIRRLDGKHKLQDVEKHDKVQLEGH